MVRWFFLRVPGCDEGRLPRLEKDLGVLGSVVDSGIGTVALPSAAWFVIGIHNAETSAVRAALGKLSMNDQVDLVAPVSCPVEGRALVRQLPLF